MRRTGALAVALSSAALLGFTALTAAPAASAAPVESGKEKAPAFASTGTTGAVGGGDEMPYGVALQKLDDGSLSLVALTEDDIDDEDGDWQPVG
ncbi:hypothetical protein GCM10010400_41600 [Streptomyces aculeolatus]|uniref:hypothetical protein n=1 Tax=Streptomyces aculeolatus TaxID=270689 RepID=UPI001CED3BFB|nr:hypothetical protein [Streptomyces aculeolatus]